MSYDLPPIPAYKDRGPCGPTWAVPGKHVIGVSVSDRVCPRVTVRSGTQHFGTNLLIRRFPYRRPVLFRSVGDLGCVAVGCPRTSGESQSSSSPWLPASLPVVLDAWHLGALVLIITAAPVPMRRPHYCPAQTPPSNPAAAGPLGRRVVPRIGVADHEVTPQVPWTGSGWRGYSYGGSGEATRTSTRLPRMPVVTPRLAGVSCQLAATSARSELRRPGAGGSA